MTSLARLPWSAASTHTGSSLSNKPLTPPSPPTAAAAGALVAAQSCGAQTAEAAVQVACVVVNYSTPGRDNPEHRRQEHSSRAILYRFLTVRQLSLAYGTYTTLIAALQIAEQLSLMRCTRGVHTARKRGGNFPAWPMALLGSSSEASVRCFVHIGAAILSALVRGSY